MIVSYFVEDVIDSTVINHTFRLLNAIDNIHTYICICIDILAHLV